MSNATEMLIVSDYKDLMESSTSIAKRFNVSDTFAHEVFDRYVKLERLSLTDAISVDEVFLDMDDYCKYALVIQDFHTGDPIDLLRSRRTNVTEPYFTSIPIEERLEVRLALIVPDSEILSLLRKLTAIFFFSSTLSVDTPRNSLTLIIWSFLLP